MSAIESHALLLVSLCNVQRLPEQIRVKHEKMKEEMMGNYCTFVTIYEANAPALEVSKEFEREFGFRRKHLVIISLNKPLNRFKAVNVLIQHLDVVHNLIGFNCNYKSKSA